jgi:Tol biopolymer transport system component
MDLRTRTTSPLFETPVVEIRYTQGYLLYVRTDNAIAAIRFDPATGRTTGAPVDIATNVSVSTIGFAQWAVADNGTVVYIPGAESDLIRVNRDGRITVLQETRRRYHSPRISPDGSRISYDDVSSEGRDVWVYSESSHDVKRATFQRDGHDSEWTADGKGLYYMGANGSRLGIFHTTLGTTAPARAESLVVEVAHTGMRVRGDSSLITTVAGAKGRGLDIVRIVPGSAKVDTLLGTEADETFAAVSPDGRWFAYVSDHSSRPELYIRSLSGSDVQLQVSVDGASEPVWARDGREIFYRSGTKLLAARLQLGTEPIVIDRKELFDVTGYDAAAPHAAYDVSPDGSWFVFARRGGANHIVVLQNVAELARRAARGGATPP